MKNVLRSQGPIVFTLLAVAVSLVVLKHVWSYYYDDPWTRDARIRADVVQVAPDVTGPITEVKVDDNQLVRRGQPLFVIDQARFMIALKQAEATLLERRTSLVQLRRAAARNHQLRELVAQEVVEEGQSKVEQAQAALTIAESAVGIARLNLERTTVYSPVDGFLNDRSVRVGDYVTAGRPVLSVVDSGSFYVDSYFEETKLRSVQVGRPVRIHVMGEEQVLHGHVRSIAAAIEDRDRSSGPNLLPSINPTFNWIRLAQRIPVRIAIDQPPPEMRLTAGRTASVTILATAAAVATDTHVEPIRSKP
ncbi:efflux RND transporter periplasmic adaptor subunit [Cupriavidus consociatus]|uniref:efflux RND transporter periplasmic adaptor subunit n=1 Tax=Cupriavidus consociatus TaxID=2821357 RepID=UPI001AE75AFB|nr:HlyD family secretion protein [Cupriavidus sp. LEh21]MBP0623182.1 HlyD family secretion protein [Cupriavidus sp. LEh25]MDK2659876.1 HlyD family secretion protein [Cupriavidus sp. LEh21]